MSNGQETPTLELRHATWGLNAGQVRRNSRQRFILPIALSGSEPKSQVDSW
jgi:hypothetical protein